VTMPRRRGWCNTHGDANHRNCAECASKKKLRYKCACWTCHSANYSLGGPPGKGKCKTCKQHHVLQGHDLCGHCLANEPQQVRRECEGIGNREIRQILSCPECGSTNVLEINENEDDGFVMEPGGVGAECLDCEFRGRGSEFDWVDEPVMEAIEKCKGCGKQYETREYEGSIYKGGFCAECWASCTEDEDAPPLAEGAPLASCTRCGGAAWDDIDGGLCHECALQDDVDATLVPRTGVGIGNREFVEVPERKCPSCGFHEISITYDKDHIYCSACSYEGPPRYVEESFDSSSLGGGGVADLRSVPIPSSVPKTAEERGEEEPVDPEDESVVDAVIDPDHIHMKPDMFGTIPDSGMPSSVGSIGQMPIRLEHAARCASCRAPLSNGETEKCDKCWATDEYEVDLFGVMPGIGGREIPFQKQCPECGDTLHLIETDPDPANNDIECSHCGYQGEAAALSESVEITCSECGNAKGGDGLCTDYTCLGSEAPSEVGAITPPDPNLPQSRDPHLDPATNTNTMWKGLGDETPDYRV
jgi:hypothetical protein